MSERASELLRGLQAEWLDGEHSYNSGSYDENVDCFWFQFEPALPEIIEVIAAAEERAETRFDVVPQYDRLPRALFALAAKLSEENGEQGEVG